MRSRRLLAIPIIAALGFSLVPSLPALATAQGGNGPIGMETVDAQGNPAIGVFHPGQQGVTFLIAMPDIRDPAWSPDGTKIAFAARASGASDLKIFVAGADGTDPTAVSTGPTDDEPAWSPDGSSIAYTSRGSGGATEVDAVELGTGDTRKISGGLAAADSPTWSPDGNTIAVSGSYEIGDPSGSCGMACATGIFRVAVDGSSQPLPLVLTSSASWVHPDWSPDGTRLLTTLSDGTTSFGVVVFNVSDGQITAGPVGPQGADHGVWSPDGTRIAVDSPNPPTGTAVFIVDLQGNLIQWFTDASVGDPAWATMAANPPSIAINLTGEVVDGWTSQAMVFVAVNAPQGIADIVCDLDGGHARSLAGTGIDPFIFYGGANFDAPEGDHAITCAVTDRAGQGATQTVTFRLDRTGPTVSGFSANPLTVRTDQTVDVGMSATDDGSGVRAGEIRYSGPRGSGHMPMTLSGTTLHGTLGPGLAGGLYSLEASATDRVGNEASSSMPFRSLVVYDTTSRSQGRGAFAPTPFDSKLPGIDGRSKLRFRFGIRYRRPLAVSPTGWFGFDYSPGGLHVRATSFDWLAHLDDLTYVLRGTAWVDGVGSLDLVAYLTDGGGTASDGIEVRLWPVGAPMPTSDETATYALSGRLAPGTIVNDAPPAPA